MKVNKTIETPNGPITFQGELTNEELDLVIEVGLNFLLAQGALPMKAMDHFHDAHVGPETEQ